MLSNLCDPEIKRLNKLQVAEPDEKKQVEILHEIQEGLWEILPIVSLGRNITHALAYKYVLGWRNSAYHLGYVHASDIVNVRVDK